MTARSLLKQWFSSKKKPTETQFAEMLDSMFHRSEDSIGIDKVTNLATVLGAKADAGVANTALTNSNTALNIAQTAIDVAGGVLESINQPNGIAGLGADGKISSDQLPDVELPENPLPVGGVAGQILSKATNADFAVEWIDPPQGSGAAADGLVSGGAASVVGSVLTIQPAVWRISGVNYETDEPTIFNIAAADPINSRYDVVVGSDDGLAIISGDASANPVKPNLPANSIEIAFAFVQPGSISAGGVLPADFATKQDVESVTGDKTLLNTSTKNNLVVAINEVNSKIGAINQESVILKIFKKSNYR